MSSSFEVGAPSDATADIDRTDCVLDGACEEGADPREAGECDLREEDVCRKRSASEGLDLGSDSS